MLLDITLWGDGQNCSEHSPKLLSASFSVTASSEFRQCCDGSGHPEAFGVPYSVVAPSAGHRIMITHNRVVVELQ